MPGVGRTFGKAYPRVGWQEQGRIAHREILRSVDEKGSFRQREELWRRGGRRKLTLLGREEPEERKSSQGRDWAERIAGTCWLLTLLGSLCS